MINKTSKLRWIYLTGFFLILALPILSFPPLFHPPAFSKTLVFRTILSLLILTFLYEVLFSDKKEVLKRMHSLKKRRSAWILLALLAAFFLATIFSVNPSFSFWGDPFRGGGFLNFAFYILFCFLAFLILDKEDWIKIWNWELIVGGAVALIALLQKFELLPGFFFHYGRPGSMLGNPIHLATYLMLLSFLSLAFGLKNKNKIKKGAYLLLLLLFVVAVLISKTRAVYIGFLIALSYFIFSYPKKIPVLKISFLTLLVMGGFGFYYLKTNPEFLVLESSVLGEITQRVRSVSPETLLPRRSAWKISLKGIREKPVFGFGPGNFEVVFNKHYTPSLPGMGHRFGSNWWDRAHNIVLEIAVTAGIPALLLYLSLFAASLLNLQKVKKEGEKKITAHAVQAGLLGYFVANLSSFDTFSTYLVFFLLIGYALHLTQKKQNLSEPRIPAFLKKYGQGLILASFLLVVLFIYLFNIKPLLINQKINVGEYLSGAGRCEKGLAVMEKAISSRSFLDHYARLKYTEAVKNCINANQLGEDKEISFAQKTIAGLEQNTEQRPLYVKNWFLLQAQINFLLKKIRLSSQATDPEMKRILEERAGYYFEKARELAPGRGDIVSEYAETKLQTKKYEEAEQIAQECIDLNPEMDRCWWQKGLVQIRMGKVDKGEENIREAQKRGYHTGSKGSILSLIRAYGYIAEKTQNKEYYQPLVGFYKKLLKKDPENLQYLASLAYTYKKLGQYDEAKEQALKILEIYPESREDIEKFLETLK